MDEKERMLGKYLPITRQGHVRFYLPLEHCADIKGLEASGYDVADDSRRVIRIIALIKEAADRTADSEIKKRKFVADSLRDFSPGVGAIEVVCPCCLGKINHNCPSREGEVLCGWYDDLTSRCDGNAFYTIDRVSLLVGLPDVERYTCPVRTTRLELDGYDLRYLKEEVDRRSSAIRGKAPLYDEELAKIFPLRISLERTRQSFKQFIFGLVEKEAIDWLNTLSISQLASLLERAAARKTPVMKVDC